MAIKITSNSLGWDNYSDQMSGLVIDDVVSRGVVYRNCKKGGFAVNDLHLLTDKRLLDFWNAIVIQNV